MPIDLLLFGQSTLYNQKKKEKEHKFKVWRECLKQTIIDIVMTNEQKHYYNSNIYKILGGYILHTGYILWGMNLSGYFLCHWLDFVVGKIDAKCNWLHFVAGYILCLYRCEDVKVVKIAVL